VIPVRWLGLTASFQGSTDRVGNGARPSGDVPVESKQPGREQSGAMVAPAGADQPKADGGGWSWPWTAETDRRRTQRAPDTDRRRTPRSAKAHLFVTICHWSMVGFLALSLLTGMRIGWGYLESPLGGPTGRWGAMLGAVSPKGTLFGVNVITLHVLLAFFMLLTVGVYVGYLLKSRTTRRLQLTGDDVRKLTTALRAGTFWRSKGALWSANLIVYWVAFVFIAVLTVTGVALYRLEWGLARLLGGYETTRLLHDLAAYLFLPYTIVHIVLQWCFGRFWAIFKAQFYRPHLRAGLVGLAVAVPVIVGLYLWNEVPESLTVMRIAESLPAPAIDGDPGDPAWGRAQSITIRTTKGVNNPHSYVDVTVKALHDGQQVYFQWQWDDPDVSYKRFPLVKTEKGWKVLQTAYEQADENYYYEDKLSMYITDVKNGSCADTCHIGVGPYAARVEKHGLHYTKGEIGDVWHWKAVRSDPMVAGAGDVGFLDDQHFRGADPVPLDYLYKRYTAGYYPDPGRGYGYDYNFVKLDPYKPVGETYVQPLFLPPTNGIQANQDPRTSEQGVTWWIQRASGIPYTEAADTYPVGSMIPNIVLAPFQGDRADVRAKGAWKDGRWTVEARRKLDTQSPYDVPFLVGQPVYISVALYNRTQTRHSEHIRPVRVTLHP
jgi:cytochrome b subunit of formate dehydrogenase